MLRYLLKIGDLTRRSERNEPACTMHVIAE